MLSINAGCIRMLLPESLEYLIPEFKTGKKVIVSRGPWPAEGRTDAFEIMFEDYSSSPFAFQTGIEQWVLVPRDDEKENTKWKFSIYTKDKGIVYEKKCGYRRVPEIPWMKAWGEGV